MKKLIAILAVFAFMTAALFAQDAGTWSVGGSGRIGTRINFLPVELSFSDGNVDHALVWADGWDQNRDENVLGKLNLTYNKGGLSTGFQIDQFMGVQAKLNFNGENWQFGAEQNLNDLITDPTLRTSSHYRDQLWGNFTFQVLNGIKVEAAVSRRGQQFWNVTDIFGDTFTHTDWGRGGISAGSAGFALDGKLGSPSYLLVDASPMAGLNIGFVIPNMFVYNPAADNAGVVDLQAQALQQTVFGAKYASGPLQIGFQFALKGQQASFYNKDWEVTNKRDDLRSGLYLSARYQISPEMSAAAEFRGIFGAQALVYDGAAVTVWNGTGTQPTGSFVTIGDDLSLFDGIAFKDASAFGIGAQFDFAQGPFGVNLRLRFRENSTATDHSETFYVRVRPYYNLVEGFLRAQLTAEFTFLDAIEKYDDKGKAVYAGVMQYVVQPELYFNFLGTGAGSWGTGFAVRYRLAGPRGYFEPTKGHNTDNFMELVFNWSF